jgi:hypothetical protein
MSELSRYNKTVDKKVFINKFKVINTEIDFILKKTKSKYIKDSFGYLYILCVKAE